MTTDLNRYSEFVEAVTSEASNNLETMITRLQMLESSEPKLNVSLLITSYTGMSSEAGEFSDLFKKIIFHGKPWDEAAKSHALRELGDVAWYWVNACRAIGVDPNDVIAENVRKLEARYPGGKFDVSSSENRKVGDN